VLHFKFPPRITAKRIFRYFLLFAGGAILVLCLVFVLVYAGALGHIPSVNELQNIQNHLSSEVYSNEKVLLGKYYYQDRTNVRYQDLPDHLIEALISTEDQRFYEHSGVDSKSALRVIIKSILLRNKESGGGSTLHQQLAKNLYPRKSYTLFSMPVNKYREMIIGVRLQKAYLKSEILELYLNTVSFGENTYGIETAAYRFFNKLPRELKIEESALLVGLLKGTHIYSPRLYPERSLTRRNLVLSLMHETDALSKEAADSLSALPLELDYVNLNHNEGLAPYFREHLRMVLLDWVKKNPKEDGSSHNIYTDGLKIYTSINADLQAYAEQAMKTQMARLQSMFDRQWRNRHPLGNRSAHIIRQLEDTHRYRSLKKTGLSRDAMIDSMNLPHWMEIFTWEGVKKVEMSVYDSIAHYAKFLHAGLLSVEANSGYVRAWVGGINSTYFKYDHVSSRRQAGSTFKPIVYSAALRNGMSPCSYFANDSVVYEAYNDWTPRNSKGGYGGYYSMKGALTHSVNTVSVKVLEKTGIKEVIKHAQQMGIAGELPEMLSLALGTGDVSLKEMVRAYSIFLNDGRLIEPVFLKRIEDKFGNVLFEEEQAMAEQVIEPQQALIMKELLKGVVDRGTASSLRTVYGFENEVAGKTGTTQHNTDGWFIGFTPVLITGVWVGGDHPRVRFRYGSHGQGAASALPIWARYMQKIYRDPLYRYSKELSFDIPDEVTKDLECEDYLDSPREVHREMRRPENRRRRR